MAFSQLSLVNSNSLSTSRSLCSISCSSFCNCRVFELSSLPWASLCAFPDSIVSFIEIISDSCCFMMAFNSSILASASCRPVCASSMFLLACSSSFSSSSTLSSFSCNFSAICCWLTSCSCRLERTSAISISFSSTKKVICSSSSCFTRIVELSSSIAWP